MSAVPVIVKLLAEKDASIDRVTQQVAATLQGIGRNAGNPLGPLSQGAATATVAVRQLGQSLKTDLATTSSVDTLTADVRALSAAMGVSVAETQKLTQALKALSEVPRPSQAPGTPQAGGDVSKSSDVTGATAAVGATATAAGAALLGLGGSAVKTAADFEQLQAKLITVKGSTEEAAASFEYAKKFAAQTPFDVQGVVGATVKLEAYGQRAENVLPRVAALAAGLGRPIQDTALVIGKAFSGSAEGFESLRNEYGITTDKLKRFGAEVDASGQLLLRNEGQILKARAAVSKIIDTNFGTAIARQSATAAGALSNAGDAVTNLAASFGKSLLPIAASGLKVFAEFADSLNTKIPAGMKAMLAGATLAVGGLFAVSGAVALAVTGLVILNTQLAAVAGNSAITAIGLRGTSLALKALNGVASAGTYILDGFGKSVIATSLGLAGLIATIGSLIIEYYRMKAIQDGLAIEEESKRVAVLNQEYRKLLGTINGLAKNKGVEIIPTGNFEQQAAQIKTAFEKLSDEELVNAFTKAGESTDTLTKKSQQLAGQTKNANDRMLQLAKGIKAVDDAEKARMSPEGNTRSADRVLNSEITSDGKNRQQLLDEIKQVNLELVRLGAESDMVNRVLGSFKKVSSPIEDAAKSAAKLKDFLDYSEQLNTVQSLEAALAAVTKEGKRNATLPGVDNLDRASLVAKLKTVQDGPMKNAIKAQLELYKTEEDLQKKLAALRKKETDDRIREDDLRFRRARALGQETLAEELAAVNSRLAAVKIGTAEEVELLEKKAALTKSIREKETETVKAAITEQVRAAQASVANVKNTPDSTPLEAIKAYDALIRKVRELEGVYAPVLAKNKELRRYLEDMASSAVRERAAEAQRQKGANLDALKGFYGEQTAEAVTAAQRLRTIESAILGTKQAISSQLVTQRSGEQYLVDLAKQRAAAEKAVAAEKRAQAAELRQLDAQVRDQDLATLEQRASSGENVEEQLTKARRAAYQARLADLRAAADDELAAHGNTEDAKAFIEQKYARQRELLIREETQRLLSAYAEREKAKAEHDGKMSGKSLKDPFSLGGFSLQGFLEGSSSYDPGRYRRQDTTAERNRARAQAERDAATNAFPVLPNEGGFGGGAGPVLTAPPPLARQSALAGIRRRIQSDQDAAFNADRTGAVTEQNRKSAADASIVSAAAEIAKNIKQSNTTITNNFNGLTPDEMAQKVVAQLQRWMDSNKRNAGSNAPPINDSRARLR